MTNLPSLRPPRWAAQAGALLLCCTLLLVSCKQREPDDTSDTNDTAVNVQIGYPSAGPISEEIVTDAVLAPLSQAAITSRISAPIRVEYVERGAHVHKGQLLLTLEDRDLQGNALDSKGGVAQAQAAYFTAVQATIPEDVQKAQLDVAQAKVNLEVADRTAEERKRLLGEGAIAGRDTDTSVAAAVQARATYDAAVKRLSSVQNTTARTSKETAQGQLTSARGRLASAEAQVSYANLRSPISGVVTDRPLFPGETASAGTPVITVMNTMSLLAKLHVAQATAQQLQLGGSAELQIPGIPRGQSATVSFISPALDPGSTTVEVWLKLANADGRYRVGTPVHATIRGRTIPDAIQVPPAAILPAGDGSTAVLLVNADGTAHKRAVTVGLRTPTSVQITAGVTVADRVITGGGYGLDDGAKVRSAANELSGVAADKGNRSAGKPGGGGKN